MIWARSFVRSFFHIFGLHHLCCSLCLAKEKKRPKSKSKPSKPSIPKKRVSAFVEPAWVCEYSFVFFRILSSASALPTCQYRQAWMNSPHLTSPHLTSPRILARQPIANISFTSYTPSHPSFCNQMLLLPHQSSSCSPVCLFPQFFLWLRFPWTCLRCVCN